MTGTKCNHGVQFDEEWAKRERPGAYEVRERYPRLVGPCPNGCGYSGICYASMAHMIWGDW